MLASEPCRGVNVTTAAPVCTASTSCFVRMTHVGPSSWQMVGGSRLVTIQAPGAAISASRTVRALVVAAYRWLERRRAFFGSP